MDVSMKMMCLVAHPDMEEALNSLRLDSASSTSPCLRGSKAVLSLFFQTSLFLLVCLSLLLTTVLLTMIFPIPFLGGLLSVPSPSFLHRCCHSWGTGVLVPSRHPWAAIDMQPCLEVSPYFFVSYSVGAALDPGAIKIFNGKNVLYAADYCYFFSA